MQIRILRVLFPRQIKSKRLFTDLIPFFELHLDILIDFGIVQYTFAFLFLC